MKTLLVRVDSLSPQAEVMAQAAKILQGGGLVVFPTETVYGLAASIDSEAGLKKIFTIKERPFFDPLIVHVNSFKQAASLVREWFSAWTQFGWLC